MNPMPTRRETLVSSTPPPLGGTVAVAVDPVTIGEKGVSGAGGGEDAATALPVPSSLPSAEGFRLRSSACGTGGYERKPLSY